MPAEVEGVMDSSVSGEEALGGAGRLEPLLLPLPSPHGLMRVFRPVVLAQALLMAAREAQLASGRTIGAQLGLSRCRTWAR